MPNAVVLPKLGQTVEEASIVKWRRKEGDKVARGDVLFDVETDKAVLEAESFFDGTLLKILVGEGETVPVSTVVAYIGKPGEKVPEGGARKSEVRGQRAEVRGQKSEGGRRGGEDPGPKMQDVTGQPVPGLPPSAARLQPSALSPQPFFISPRARKRASEVCVDPSPIRGTGPGGRVVVRDVEAYLELQGYDRLRITPAARRLAAAEGMDILTVKGAGDAGRITAADIRRAVTERPRPMSRMRRTIARRVTESFATTPHFYVTVSADMTDLLAFRQKLKDRGETYTVTDFILEAVVLSLREFPIVNSVTDGENVRWRAHVDLGLAVGLDDGLVVPVIRHAEDLSLAELHDRARDAAERARENRLQPEEMSGSSFTVSNMGMLKVEDFHAIINPGEAGILAVSSTMPQAAVRDGKIAVRSMMKMTLSADHRIVDGATGAGFLNAVKARLEDLELWKRMT